MTSEQKRMIDDLRLQGIGYKKIASELGISENTVKSYCRRSPEVKKPVSVEDKPKQPTAMKQPEYEGNTEIKLCRWCGKPVAQNPGRKEKKFCSDVCRTLWWNKNKFKVSRKTTHTFLCPTCGEEFSVYGNSKRKYCSHACYIAGRFYGGAK